MFFLFFLRKRRQSSFRLAGLENPDLTCKPRSTLQDLNVRLDFYNRAFPIFFPKKSNAKHVYKS